MVVVAFSSRARILGECSTIHSPPEVVVVVVVVVVVCVCFKVIRSHTLVPLLKPGSIHSGSAS